MSLVAISAAARIAGDVATARSSEAESARRFARLGVECAPAMPTTDLRVPAAM